VTGLPRIGRSPPEPFDLHAFNPLPRPAIDAALCAGTPQSLGLIFPYLFKPNRAVAWVGDPVGFPLKDRNLRWLFGLPTPPAWPGPFLAALGTDGVLSLWRYRLASPNDPDAGGGLYPLALSPDCGSPASSSRFMRLTGIGGADDPSRGFFEDERQERLAAYRKIIDELRLAGGRGSSWRPITCWRSTSRRRLTRSPPKSPGC
jgi:hypothetical protein